MAQIEKDKAEADETRAVVVKEEAVASTKAEECQQIKDSAERDLAEALPALDAAVAVLRNLKLSDLSEVAKYANPPAGVKLVMEAMCVLKAVPPKMVGAAGQKVADYWEPGKKMLADAKGLLDSMFNFDKDNIPPKIIKAVTPYIENEDFEPKKIEAVSKACTAMCQVRRAATATATTATTVSFTTATTTATTTLHLLHHPLSSGCARCTSTTRWRRRSSRSGRRCGRRRRSSTC